MKVVVEFDLPADQDQGRAEAKVKWWLDRWLEENFRPDAVAKVTYKVIRKEGK